jgi:hypothetical protein
LRAQHTARLPFGGEPEFGVLFSCPNLLLGSLTISTVELAIPDWIIPRSAQRIAEIAAFLGGHDLCGAWARARSPRTPHRLAIDTSLRLAVIPSSRTVGLPMECNGRPSLFAARLGLLVTMNLHTDGLVGTIDIGPLGCEGWRHCAVAVRADGFSADYDCTARKGELEEFVSGLETALAHLGQPARISFQLMERGIGFELELSKGGHVDGKYQLGRDWRGPFLSGSFSADQTHLRAWANELKAALAR